MRRCATRSGRACRSWGTSGDAVAAGHVVSLARPGGNITGLSVLDTELSPKRLQLLRGAAPGGTRLAILFNPADAGMLRPVAEAQTPPSRP